MTAPLYLSTRKGLFTIERRGGKWAITGTHFLGDAITLALPSPRDGTLFAAFEHGHFGVKLHRSRDGGRSWHEATAPAYPPKPPDLVDKDGWGRPLEWKVAKIWALETGSQPGELWAGTIPGGLFHSTDHGDSWQLVESLWRHPMRSQWFGGGADLPGIHSVCVDPRDGNHISVGVSCGGVWQTRDHGATWQCPAEGMWAAYMPPERKFDPNIQDAHILVQCPGKPDCFWVQHHNGIFRSTDNSATWQDIKDVPPSVFGFAVAVHPKDPETAWFVPAIKDEKRIPVDGKVVVTRTRDGGKTFEVLRNGLPQEHAYDLTFRHALDIDATGTTLAFGSTTGSVWISDNQGDSWQCLSSHLPPVYAVRFGD
jgi:hypothetical protein